MTKKQCARSPLGTSVTSERIKNKKTDATFYVASVFCYSAKNVKETKASPSFRGLGKPNYSTINR
ncbi:hypothetical protein [Sporolactobacillus spathodeae]|uniref:Uncharacterized protein n=1 Tax=Sporolactobacillus spathodeae TaxID=1465502 RepID=A0ABS2Q7U6_9BACL|nr:hypothetical protein [Sporolactobacillus spathodeae]MBM7657510.1 hypothetical protein [Sporolactobacillus spathodeae]